MTDRNLIIVRHGTYSKRGENPKLTRQGRQQIQSLGEFIVEKNTREDFFIATSPLIRAVESAKILVDTLRGNSKLEIWDELNCEYETLFSGQAQRINKKIANNRFPKNTVLVGHYALRDFARYYVQQLTGTEKEFKIRDLKTGHAIEITQRYNNQNSISYIP